MASINDGAEGLNKSVSEAVRSAEQGVLTATKFQKIIQDAKGDYSAIVTSIIAADKEMKKGAATWTTVGNIAKQIGEESAEWVTHYKNAAGGVKGMSIAMKKLAESAGDAADKQQTHEDSVKNVMMLLKASVDQSSRYGVQLKAIEKQEKEILATMSAHGESAKKLQEAKSELAEIDKKIRDLGADQTAEGQKTLDVLAKQRDAAAGLVAEQSQSVVMADEQKKAFYEQLNALEKQKEEVRELAENAEEYKNSMTGAASSAMGLFKGMLKASPKELRDKQSKFKAISEDAKTMGAGKGAVGKAAAGALGAAADIGSMVSGLLMKLNLPMMIAQAVIAAFDMAIDFIYKNDAIVKKFNNVFQEVTAPVTDGKAFIKGAQTFSNTLNTASGDAGKYLNFQLGVTADEWSSMWKSMASKGMSMQGLTGDDPDNQVKAMKAVRHSSLVMGKSLDEMGSDMAEWAVQFKSPFEGIQKSMDKMGFAAKRAGLTGKYFLDTVNQSVLSLATYGRFTDVASAALEKFSKSGIVSQKTAGEAAKQFTDFLSGDYQMNLKILGLAKAQGADPTELWKESLGERKAQLGATAQGSPEWKKLHAEIAVMEDVLKLDAGARDAAMAQNAKYMTDKTGKIMDGFLKNFDAGGTKSLAEISMLLSTQLPKDLLDVAMVTASDTKKSMEEMAAEIGDGSSASAKSIQGFLSNPATQKDLSAYTTESVAKLMKSIDSMSGVSEGTKSGLKALLDSKDSFQKVINAKGKISPRDLNRFAATAGVDIQSGPKETQKVGDQAAQIDSLTELQKRMGITKDTAKYVLASSNMMQTAAGFLGGILETINKIFKLLSESALFSQKDQGYEDAITKGRTDAENEAPALREAERQRQLAAGKEDVGGEAGSGLDFTPGGVDDMVQRAQHLKFRAEAKAQMGDKATSAQLDKAVADALGPIMVGTWYGSHADVSGEGEPLLPGEVRPTKNAGGGIASGVSGIVPGTAISGDSIPTNMLNSKEMILNTAQQANLFRMLDFGGALPTGGSSGGGSDSGPVRVANVTVNVSGVSGDEVVKAIQKYWANAKFWEGTKPGYGTPV